MMSDDELMIRLIAARMRESDVWDMDDMLSLVLLADMEEEFEAADGDNFENVVFAAAEKLGVEII